MNYSWMPLLGNFTPNGDGVIFRGRILNSEPPAGQAGYAICDQVFAGGTITADIEFTSRDYHPSCELILWHEPNTPNMLVAGMGGGGFMFSIRSFNSAIGDSKWTNYATAGSAEYLESGRVYRIVVELQGSRITMKVDGVVVATTNLMYPLPPSQVGVFAISSSDIVIHRFEVQQQQSRAFIVMEFGSEFEELYTDVIRPACIDLKLDFYRADEAKGPGIIIADIANRIEESKVIIAEVTPPNRNVYFEVGYAHALRKPVILLAKKGTQLPFDLSPFRHIFYEDSIGGKRRIELALQEHIAAALSTGETP
jgi:hypothetical protein